MMKLSIMFNVKECLPPMIHSHYKVNLTTLDGESLIQKINVHYIHDDFVHIIPYELIYILDYQHDL